MAFQKGQSGNPNGRKAGVANKTTQAAKDAIAQAAADLGGSERLVTWAKSDPKNEQIFWGQIYPKLLPHQITGPNDGPLIVERVMFGATSDTE